MTGTTVIVSSTENVLTSTSNSNTEVVVSSTGNVLTSNSNTEVVVTGIMGPPGASSISGMSDIDKTELTDGATLVYNSSNAFWKATNKLDNQILEAGQF